MKAHSLSVVLSVSGLLILGGQLQAEKKPATPPEGRETVAKPMSEKDRRKQEEKLRKELMGPYRKWLNEDVGYIITDEERQSFKRLATDDERQSSSNRSGFGAIRRRTRPKTNTRKSTIAVSRTRTSVTRRAYPGGKRIAAESTSPWSACGN